jgi:hypothetical protein
MKLNLATRKDRLAYASKIGGMLAKQQTKVTGFLVTLDRSFWNGNSYTWTFNVNEGGYCHKQLVTSKTILAMFDSQGVPEIPIHHMLTKLHNYRHMNL